MKNHLFFVFMLAILTMNLHAQQVALGARVGMNIANVSYTQKNSGTTPEMKNVTQFLASIPLEIRFSPSFAIQPELSYLEKGFSISQTYGSTSASSTVTFNYFDIPIVGKLGFTANKLQLDLLAGPRFGYLLGGKLKGESTVSGRTTTEERNLNADDLKTFNRFEVGLDFGASVQYPISNFKLVFDVRYLLGLTDISNDSPDNETVINRGISLSIGIMKPFGGKE